jgi:hypothetical protein
VRHALYVAEIHVKPADLFSVRPARTSRWARIGIALLALSFALWLPLPLVPFLPIDIGAKTALGAGLFVAAEACFWLGAALVGPEALKRMRSWFRLRRRSLSAAERLAPQARRSADPA